MLKKIIIDRTKLGLTWDLLAEGLPIAGNSLRTAFKREKVDQVYLNHVNAVIEDFKNKQGISEKEIITKPIYKMILIRNSYIVYKKHKNKQVRIDVKLTGTECLIYLFKRLN